MWGKGEILRRLPSGWAWRLRAGKARWFGEPEINMVAQFLKPGDCAVDIGAHWGVYTYWMARRVGPRGRVYAFEPQPAFAQFLERAIGDLHCRQVDVSNVGLSDRAERVTLTIPVVAGHQRPGLATLEPRNGGEHESVEIDVYPLDSLLQNRAQPISFIKCDVEGHEDRVFRGAENVITQDRPTLLFECVGFLRDAPVAAAFAYLESLGYRGYFLDHRMGRHPICEFDPDVHQTPYVDTPSDPRHVRNFLFVDGG